MRKPCLFVRFTHFAFQTATVKPGYAYHFIFYLHKSRSVYESKGHRFESCWVHHKNP